MLRRRAASVSPRRPTALAFAFRTRGRALSPRRRRARAPRPPAKRRPKDGCFFFFRPGFFFSNSSKKKSKIPSKEHTPRTMDHLARGSMKIAASCAMSCNPQVIRTPTNRTHIAASVTHGSRATPV